MEVLKTQTGICDLRKLLKSVYVCSLRQTHCGHLTEPFVIRQEKVLCVASLISKAGKF
jgi:hypothetical protein